MRVLIVKTSSLGDLVHMLPALSDARRARPDVAFDWLCEKPFADIPTWHPAVRRVIPCELRRWRNDLWGMWQRGEWQAFKQTLQTQSYDVIVDAQGLFKSAFLARQAHGPVVGHQWEWPASWLYDRRITLPAPLHAVNRMRALLAQALGYPQPTDVPDYGIERSRFASAFTATPYVVFLHATTWPTKCWPLDRWQTLGRWCREQSYDVLLPWGSDAEKAQAEQIAQPFGGRVLPRLDLTAMAGVLAQAKAVVGVDTGLAHVAAAVNTPSVTLYGPTVPALTGTMGPRQVHVCATDARTVDKARPNTVDVTRAVDSLRRLLLESAT